MSKHGFNENELVKTIITMIDKDGFHKEVVSYGNTLPSTSDSGMRAGGFRFEASADATLYIVNVPEKLFSANFPEANIFYTTPSFVDEDFYYDIGDDGPYDDPLINTVFYDISAEIVFISEELHIIVFTHRDAIEQLPIDEDGSTKIYYQIYAVDPESSKIIDRTKAVIGIRSSGDK